MAVNDAYVFPGFLTPVLTQLFFPKPPLLFSHASSEVRGENTLERKVASSGDRTHNHQVMSPTRSPLSHPGGVLHTKHAYMPCNAILSIIRFAKPASASTLRVFSCNTYCEPIRNHVRDLVSARNLESPSSILHFMALSH